MIIQPNSKVAELHALGHKGKGAVGVVWDVTGTSGNHYELVTKVAKTVAPEATIHVVMWSGDIIKDMKSGFESCEKSYPELYEWKNGKPEALVHAKRDAILITEIAAGQELIDDKSDSIEAYRAAFMNLTPSSNFDDISTFKPRTQ
jgi:hypothetical protein